MLRAGNCPTPASTRSRSPSRSRVWSALQRYTAASLRSPEGSPIARLPGTQPRAGFEVLDSAPGPGLTLAGRHRFARYRLTFDLTDAAEGATRLRAQTCALCLAPVARPAASWSSAPGLTPPPPPHTAIGPAAEPRTGLKPARQARPSPASIIPGQPAHTSHSQPNSARCLLACLSQGMENQAPVGSPLSVGEDDPDLARGESHPLPGRGSEGGAAVGVRPGPVRGPGLTVAQDQGRA